MQIVLDNSAQRQLKRTPKNIVKKLRDWVVSVMQFGLREVSRRPGYHDEPLSCKRSGQRSIRLSRQWRAIYQPFSARIAIETVTPHDYRVKSAADVEALPFLNRLLGEPVEAKVQENDMDEKQRREVVATLVKAGRRDLAERFVGVRQTVLAGWKDEGQNVHILQTVVKGKDALGKPKTRNVVLRADGRGGTWRLDYLGMLGNVWEAIDDGTGFKSLSAAKKYATKWLKAYKDKGERPFGKDIPK